RRDPAERVDGKPAATDRGPEADSVDAFSAMILDSLIRPDWLDRHPHELSGGEQQRVNLARALLVGPSHLIADEITASLDPITQAELWRFLRIMPRATGSASSPSPTIDRSWSR